MRIWRVFRRWMRSWRIVRSLQSAQLQEASIGRRVGVASRADVIVPLDPTTPLASSSGTAPLRVRNKTPSPTRMLNSYNPTEGITRPAPQLPQIPTTSPFTVTRRPPPLAHEASSLGFVSSPPPLHSPDARETTTTTPLSPRLLGPRSLTISAPKSPLLSAPKSPLMGPRSPPPTGPRTAGPRPLPTTPGSGHTKLRVVSGNGRRVSAGRETIPLKTDSPTEGSTTPTMLVKRQHSEDHLTPRKRSLTRSPLEPLPSNDIPDLPDPPKFPSISKRSPHLGIGLGSPHSHGARRSSGGRLTPRKASPGGRLTPTITPRKGSAVSVVSVASNGTAGTNGTAESEDVEMADHGDVTSALNSGVQRVSLSLQI